MNQRKRPREEDVTDNPHSRRRVVDPCQRDAPNDGCQVGRSVQRREIRSTVGTECCHSQSSSETLTHATTQQVPGLDHHRSTDVGSSVERALANTASLSTTEENRTLLGSVARTTTNPVHATSNPVPVHATSNPVPVHATSKPVLAHATSNPVNDPTTSGNPTPSSNPTSFNPTNTRATPNSSNNQATSNRSDLPTSSNPTDGHTSQNPAEAHAQQLAPLKVADLHQTTQHAAHSSQTPTKEPPSTCVCAALEETIGRCMVCYEMVIVDPVSMPCCSNTVCETCLCRWLELAVGGLRCPLCNKVFVSLDLPVVDRVRRTIIQNRHPSEYKKRKLALGNETLASNIFRREFCNRVTIRVRNDPEPQPRFDGVDNPRDLLPGLPMSFVRMCMSALLTWLMLVAWMWEYPPGHSMPVEFQPQAKKLKYWNVTDVETWLHNINMTQYNEGFREYLERDSADLSALPIKELDFVEESQHKVEIAMTLEQISDSELKMAELKSPLYLWHLDSTRKYGAVLFMTGMSYFPRLTMLYCYLYENASFPKLHDAPSLLFGLALPQVVVLQFVLSGVQRYPLMSMFQIARLLASLLSDCLLLRSVYVAHNVHRVPWYLVVLNLIRNFDVAKMLRLPGLYSVLRKEIADEAALVSEVLTLSANSGEYFIVPLIVAMALENNIIPEVRSSLVTAVAYVENMLNS